MHPSKASQVEETLQSSNLLLCFPCLDLIRKKKVKTAAHLHQSYAAGKRVKRRGGKGGTIKEFIEVDLRWKGRQIPEGTDHTCRPLPPLRVLCFPCLDLGSWLVFSWRLKISLKFNN